MSTHDPSMRVLGAAAQLCEGGTAAGFEWRPGVAAFVVRYQGQPRGWVNRCPHQGTPLDWEPGLVFDEEGRHLVCATHGALFEPDTGLCVAGPCRGARLFPVPVAEQDGQLLLALPTAGA